MCVSVFDDEQIRYTAKDMTIYATVKENEFVIQNIKSIHYDVYKTFSFVS